MNAVDPYDDRSAEFMDLLAMLYFVIEVCRTDDTFGDELSECNIGRSRADARANDDSGHVSTIAARAIPDDRCAQRPLAKGVSGKEGVTSALEDFTGVSRRHEGGCESAEPVKRTVRAASKREE
jgi:hypothetical protein